MTVDELGEVAIRPMGPEDASAVSAMVYTAFRDSVAPRYSEEGQRGFFEYGEVAMNARPSPAPSACSADMYQAK